jgi:small-conductance mechanosensitive channel
MINNIWYSWSDVFNISLQNLWIGFVQFAPKLILAIILFIIGWVLGSLISKAFVQVFAALKIDKLFASIGADNLFRRAGMNLNTGYFVGEVARWFIIIVFLLPSLSLVGLDAVSSFLENDVLGFLPKIIIAVFILIIATVVSNAVSKLVVAGTRTMNVHSAHMLGTLVKYTIWIFAFIIALGQLQVADPYIPTLFTVLIGAIGLAGALAFGLGGKDAAARFLAKISEESTHR